MSDVTISGWDPAASESFEVTGEARDRLGGTWRENTYPGLACDVPGAIVARYRIGIAPTLLQIEGREYRDEVDISRDQFYADLPRYRVLPKTAAASPATFVELYRATGAQTVISIHLSAQLSAMHQSAQLAAQELGSEIAVHVFDSRNISMGTGWQVIAAAEMASRGASVADILAYLAEMRPRVRVYALLDTLTFLRRSGRVSAITAGIGEALQIKPLLEVKDGRVIQLERARLKERGVQRLIEIARSFDRLERLCVLYTGAGMEATVQRVQEALRDRVPIESQLVQQVTPGIGAHLGPGGIGVALVAA